MLQISSGSGSRGFGVLDIEEQNLFSWWIGVLKLWRNLTDHPRRCVVETTRKKHNMETVMELVVCSLHDTMKININSSAISVKLHGVKSFLRIWESLSWVRNYPTFMEHPKLHYSVHNSLPLDHILSHFNPAHAFWPTLIDFSRLRLHYPNELRISGVLTKMCKHFSSPCACYMSRLFHGSWYYRHNDIWWRGQIMKLLVL
jgi:hypothetical protein